MKTSFKACAWVLLLLTALPASLDAGQKAYLSESPNGKYRIVVEQVLERRVGDRVHFRYPLYLVNAKNPNRRFEIRDAAGPLIEETEKKTFKVRWDGFGIVEPTSVRFLWAPDSLKLFMRMEVIRDTWRTYFINVNTGVTSDITPALEAGMLDKIGSKGWDCQRPQVELSQWTKPHLAFLKLTTLCGKHRDRSNEELFPYSDSVLFDTVKGEIVERCMDCEEKKALKVFEKYFRTTLPTPTPTPEETPVIR